MTKQEDIEKVRAAEQYGLDKHGWFVHIFEEKGPEGLVNYHTHGLSSKYPNGLDLQIVWPMNHVFANLIFWEFADMLEAGEKLASGEKYLIKPFDMTVMLANAIEGGRLVYRIIMPDADGWLSPDQQRDGHEKQWTGAEIVR